jgi:hypothetical protein
VETVQQDIVERGVVVVDKQINQKTATIIIAAIVLILGGGLVYFNFLRPTAQTGGAQEAQPAGPDFRPAQGAGNEAAPAGGPGAPAAGAMGGGR